MPAPQRLRVGPGVGKRPTPSTGTAPVKKVPFLNKTR
jgi:hypothetical protein